MKSIYALMAVIFAAFCVLFGTFVSCAVAGMIGLPHPMVMGTVAWIGLFSWLCKLSYERARDERLARTRMILESTERQSQVQRDQELSSRPGWFR